jgi:hypothetical protein
MDWPVIPDEISLTAKEIYRLGLEMGRNPHHFSVIGDCQSEPQDFMGPYDVGQYNFGQDDQHLQPTIDQFSGSFNHWSKTIINGGNIAQVLVKGWYGSGQCLPDETPLDCEIRTHNPSIMFIHMGTHRSSRNSQYLRMVIDRLIEEGVLPVLVTKADNLEGNHAVNLDMASIAAEYDLPLWNFWASVQDLVMHGLTYNNRGQLMYLTVAALDQHRYTGLQMLDKIWREANQ